MPFDPTLPTEHTLADAAQMRAQFNGVVDLIQTIPQGPQGVPGPAGTSVADRSVIYTCLPSLSCTPMASDSENSPVARAVLITLAVLALYVLSMGPVWRETGLTWQVTAYQPILWTAEHCDPFAVALAWYLNLWLPHHPLPSSPPDP